MSYPNPTSGGPPLRALAMVLIALAIVFAGLGAMSLSNSETGDTDASGTSPSATSSATAAPQVPAGTPASKTTNAAPTPAGTTTTSSTTTTAGRSVPVRVLNNSMIAGLAAKTASELSANGWTIAETGNYPGTNIAKTTVYYGTSPGDREAARTIADEIGAEIAPKSSGIGDSAPGVTVIVTGN
ncbi:LytR C-terminal domain-containing protein [Nocardia sp. 2YAB30]|uniref:LytR C-terminal domain-containing protein n=1 Tax=unclassified Nocardia TaxID=2637762 RepID=UPI003F9553A3